MESPPRKPYPTDVGDEEWAFVQEAERVAWSAPGVTAVDNRITISF